MIKGVIHWFYSVCSAKRVVLKTIVVLVFCVFFTSPSVGQSLYSKCKGASSSFSLNSQKVIRGRFNSLFEPSGIAPLSDGRFLVVDDEPDQALRLISVEPTTKGLTLTENNLQMPPDYQKEPVSLGALDDLEGVAHDCNQRYYAVSSHDDGKPHDQSERQKLLRFSVNGVKMADVSVVHTLRRDLLAQYPVLHAGGKGKDKGRNRVDDLNIEALAFDRLRSVLMIGLRSPLVDGRGAVVRLLNPDGYLQGEEKPTFGSRLWLLDFDHGGIRAMMYDDLKDQLLLVSRRENHKDDAYKLWRVAADGRQSVVRVKLGKHEKLLDKVEGLAIAGSAASPRSGVLFIRDNGSRKKERGASWFLIPRHRLGHEF